MKYLAIYRDLKNRIEKREYQPDEKLPSVIQLKALYKTGSRTVQHALNMLEKEGLVQGVRSQGIFVRNRCEPQILGTKSKDTELKRVGVVLRQPALQSIPEATYIQRIVNGIGKVISDAGIFGYILDTFRKTPQEVLKEINALDLDGLICVEMDSDELLDAVRQTKLPLAHCDLVNPTDKDPVVLADHFHGGELAVQKLKELGRHELLFIHGHKKSEQQSDPTNVLRWQGIRKAAQKHRMSAGQFFISMESGSLNIARKMAAVLQELGSSSGIILGSEYFLTIQTKVLAEPGVRNQTRTDYIVFGQIEAPLSIKPSSVWCCACDYLAMGTIAARMLLTKKPLPQRVRFMPMQVSRVYTI